MCLKLAGLLRQSLRPSARRPQLKRDPLGDITMQTKTLMHLRTCSLVLGWLTWSAPSAAAQNRTAADSDLTRTTGHWTASGVTFQSGGAAHPFAVELKRVGDQLRATLPTELKLAGGHVYRLGRVGPGVFRHVDDAGRIVEVTLTGQDRASLLVTGSGGDGRVTWQLSRAP